MKNFIAIIFLVSLSSTVTLADEHRTNHLTNEQVITQFIKAWASLDAENLIPFFAEDGTYHNMMLEPVSGHDALRKFINGFLSQWSKSDWEIVNIISKGNLVIAERIDHTTVGKKEIHLPCVGVFELVNGKIRTWRDYFDLATYQEGITD